MTFTLTITLGNDAMQTSADLAAALVAVEREILNSDAVEVAGQAQVRSRAGVIRDANGNTVGEWRVSK